MRLCAAILFDGTYDLNGANRDLLPKEDVGALDGDDAVKCEEIIQKGMQNSTDLSISELSTLRLGAKAIVFAEFFIDWLVR